MTRSALLRLSVFLCLRLAAAGDWEVEESCDEESCDVEKMKATSRVFLQKSSNLLQTSPSQGKLMVFSEEEKEGQGKARIVKKHSVTERPFMPDAASNPEEMSECMEFYNKFLKGRKGVAQIASVWMGLCSTDEMRARWKEVKGGCLYLPTDEHMVHFRDCAADPNPWHNIYFLEDLFFKVDAGKSCPSAPGHGKSVAEGGDGFHSCADAEGFEGEDGTCVSATELESWESAKLRVFTLDGLMGLDDEVVQMMSLMCSPEKIAAASFLERTEDGVNQSSLNEGRKVTIPVKFVVCEGSAGSLSEVTEERMKLNVDALNRVYGGSDQCTRKPGEGSDGAGGSLEVYDVPRPKMGIQFNYHSHRKVVDKACKAWRFDTWDNVEHVRKLAPREDGYLTVMINNLHGGVAGMGIPVDGSMGMEGFIMIHHQTMPLGKMGGHGSIYSEGHMLSHEIGHYFGLGHTFQGGCKSEGIADTAPEEAPHWGCPNPNAVRRSCDGSVDPAHNIMDYSPTYCKCSFTPGQRSLIWKTIEKHAPDLWQMSKACVDNPKWGEACAVWAGSRCDGDFGDVVQANCPKSCGKCW